MEENKLRIAIGFDSILLEDIIDVSILENDEYNFNINTSILFGKFYSGLLIHSKTKPINAISPFHIISMNWN